MLCWTCGLECWQCKQREQERLARLQALQREAERQAIRECSLPWWCRCSHYDYYSRYCTCSECVYRQSQEREEQRLAAEAAEARKARKEVKRADKIVRKSERAQAAAQGVIDVARELETPRVGAGAIVSAIYRWICDHS